MEAHCSRPSVLSWLVEGNSRDSSPSALHLHPPLIKRGMHAGSADIPGAVAFADVLALGRDAPPALRRLGDELPAPRCPVGADLGHRRAAWVRKKDMRGRLDGLLRALRKAYV
jgi:hypothetical protein